MSDTLLIEQEVGFKYRSEKDRLITEQDIEDFVGLSWTPASGYQDDEAAREMGFENRLVPGPMHMPILMGLLWPVLNAPNVVILSTDKVRHKNPLHPGQTVHGELELLSKKETSRGGIVGTYSWSLINQGGVVITQGENS